MNSRRKLLVALGGGALAAPFALFGQQQGKVWRVGFLASVARPASIESHYMNGFVSGLRELGYIENKNLVIEWRFAGGKPEYLSTLSVELANLKPDLILTAGTPAATAMQKVTTTIPIVMVSVGDPVSLGLVKSLPHPGGNITGLSNLGDELGPKHLEMLTSMMPKTMSKVAVLVDPNNAVHNLVLQHVRAAARRLGVSIVSVEARSEQEIGAAFSLAIKENSRAMIICGGRFNQYLRQLAELAGKYRLPSIMSIRQYVEVGGLMSYGDNRTDTFRRAATYVDKILKGAKPADLPVEQPTKFELVINGKTAKALGLKIPQSLLIMADKVFE